MMENSKFRVLPIESAEWVNYVALVDDTSVTYIQNGDSVDGENAAQGITISTRNNGVARFLHIKTDGWSINDVDELIELLNDFKRRASLD